MLSIGRALMSSPTLLLLDEPSFGLSPLMVNAVFKSVKEINHKGVTIFLVEQNAKKALENSMNGYVMDMGNIIFEGSSLDLIKDERVRLSLTLVARRNDQNDDSNYHDKRRSF